MVYYQGMQERKRPGKTNALPELHSSVAEILVVNGRSFQPFIRTFSYTGENISKSNLGTLVGVFEIDEMSEDSAYIVNFLASVAKKEYFNNPRRGAIESFEAALHKINLALAELVKHGNVTWLGKFHGAIGVLEKNNFHFSVTGKGSILLFRNEMFSDIAEGLASEESKTHPIKTFVEVSSGRLALDDHLIMTSPELLALFTIEDLTKNARRMDHERFTQFLKTALVNELDMAGALTIDVIEEALIPEPKKAKESAKESPKEHVQNVFSQTAFFKKEKSTPAQETAPETEKKAESVREEYVDTKTGHIYVQGQTAHTPTDHPTWERFVLTLQEASHAFGSFMSTQGRLLRKGRKQSVIALLALKEESVVLGRKSVRSLRRLVRKYKESQKKKATALPPTPPKEVVLPPAEPITPVPPSLSDISHPKKEVASFEETVEEKEIIPPEESQVSSAEEPQDEIPSFMKEKLAQFYKREAAEQKPEEVLAEKTISGIEQLLTSFEIWQTKGLNALKAFFHNLSLSERGSRLFQALTHLLIQAKQSFGSLPKKRKQLILGSTATLVILLVSLPFILQSSWWKTEPTQENPATTETHALLPTNNEGTSSGELSTLLNQTGSPLVTSIVLNDETYAVTEKSVIAVAQNKSFALPGDNTALFAAAMDDLRLIFVYTRSGHLYAFSPISKNFVENTLSLPEGTRVTGIGTYLTYLYVLDSNHDQIYRFPRADGGFGAPATWLKETVAIEDDSLLAVSETLFIAPNAGALNGFFRGRQSITLEIPEGGMNLESLYTSPDLAQIYALDSEHNHLLVWNQEGKLLKTYENNRLSEGNSLSVNEKTNEAFIGTDENLLSFKLR